METEVRTPSIPSLDPLHRVVIGLAERLSRSLRGGNPANRRATPGAATPSPRRGWLAQLEHGAWRQRQRDVEAHLAKSTDVFDLEARIRNLDRAIPSRYY